MHIEHATAVSDELVAALARLIPQLSPTAAVPRRDPLRIELGDIDREILALVARRQAVSQRIGQVKREAGLPTRDYRQEKDVVERARAAAAAHGLSPALGEELVLALIRGSLTIQ